MNTGANAKVQGKIDPLVMAGGIAVAGVLIYAAVLLPHQVRNRGVARKIETLTSDIDSARTVIQRARDLESQTSDARGALGGRLQQFAGRPVEEWLPEVVRPHFERARLLDAKLNPDKTWDEPGLPGFKRYGWKVEVALAREDDGVGRLMTAVANLTAENPFIKVIDFAVQPKTDDATQLAGSMTLVILARAAGR